MTSTSVQRTPTRLLTSFLLALWTFAYPLQAASSYAPFSPLPAGEPLSYEIQAMSLKPLFLRPAPAMAIILGLLIAMGYSAPAQAPAISSRADLSKQCLPQLVSPQTKAGRLSTRPTTQPDHRR